MDEPLRAYGLTRECPACRRELPLDAYSKSQKKPYPECKECRALLDANTAQKRFARIESGFFKQLAAQICGKKLNVPHVSEVGASILDQFGTLEEFCRRWAEQVELAPDGSKTKLDGYRAFYQIFHDSTLNRETAPDVADMTPEQMEQELRGLMAQFAAEAGFKVYTEDEAGSEGGESGVA